MRHFVGFLDSLAERIAVFFVALLFSQMPQFMNLYLNVLSGAKVAQEKAVAALREKADELGMTPEQFIADLLQSTRKAAQASGELHRQQLADYERTKRAYEALKNASLWVRPFVFLRYADWALAKNVQFQPALPFTVEAFIYVLVGILSGMLLYRLLLLGPRRLLQRRATAH
ncbi:MAG: DUF2937 family protein [Turneriella sp.]|nr:DUF2937 family protein [Turneriella sp.]